MPIYEYRCKECQQLFEEWCKNIEDDNISHSCPICKGQAQRLVSHTSFALKGDGWYVTEYGSRKDVQAEKPAPSCNGTDKSADAPVVAKPEKAATSVV